MSGKFGVFNPFHEWEKGDLPCNPTINIALKEYFADEKGVITISPDLITDDEIDAAIDELQKNLESTRKEAKRTLKTQKEKMSG